jgi:hypothetical protein
MQYLWKWIQNREIYYFDQFSILLCKYLPF